MDDNLKKRTVLSVLWNGLGNTGTAVISFVSNIVLARFLEPSDFGCIAMLYVFMALSNTLINCGFGSALIQKKNPSQSEYSNVFYWNLLVAFILYFVLFFVSPAIARFYKLPLLSFVLRVHALALIVNSFGVVQETHLMKTLRFKERSKIQLISVSCGTAVAIVMAILGCGVWCLVASNLVHAIVKVILLWIISPWRPSGKFSFKPVLGLLSFGGSLAVVSIINTLYGNIQALIIGKKFSATDVGYFNQAKRLEFVPSDTVTMIVDQVTFPVFSMIRDEKKRFVSGIRSNVKAVSFVNFAIYALLIIIAFPLIHFIYGSKWDSAVPYFQILCIAGMVYSLDMINLNVIKSLGKGKLFFYTQLLTRIAGIIIIFIGIKWGIHGVLWALVVSSYLNYFVSSIVISRLVDYSITEQIKDILPSLIAVLAVGALIWYLGTLFNMNFIVKMFIQAVLFGIIYIGLSSLLKLDGYKFCKDNLIKILFKGRKNDSV